jgi:crotonobetainyl-CoA:carnitine CoA-transferase CaiB-like acyl-CoA transferase
MADTEAGCLEGLRVLDLTEESGHLAGRILADLGAEVIKVEPPGGDAARGGAALRRVVDPHPDCGAQWLTRNAGKQTTIIDLDSSAGVDTLRALARDADVLIETFTPGALAAKGIGYSDLAKLNPAIVVCSITPYGQTGPYASYRGSDLTALAASGNLFMTGDPGRAPVRCSMPVTHYHGGAEAAAAILMALWERDRSGKGQHVDVSLQETMLMPNMSHPAQAWIGKYKGKRSGAHNRVGETIQREIWPCKDGFVSFALRGGPARIPGLIAMVQYMDEHGMAPAVLKDRDWKKYNHNTVTQPEIDAISAPIGAFFLTKTMQELYDVACERRLMLAPASTEREVLQSRQLKSRNFIVEQEGPKGSRLPFPERFAQWSRTRVRGAAPSLSTPVTGFKGSRFAAPKSNLGPQSSTPGKGISPV